MRSRCTTALVFVLVACSSAPPAPSDDGHWSISIPSGRFEYVLFPQLPEPPDRTHPGDGVPADPQAPVCPSVQSTHATHTVRIRLQQRALPTLQLRVPAGYDWAQYDSPRPFEQMGEDWGGLLGDVRTDVPSAETGRYDQGPSFWVGSLAGYPTSGLEPGTVQTSFSECQLPMESTTLRLVRYSTRSPRGEVQESIAAFWEIADSVVLRTAATATTAEEFARDIAVIYSVRFVP